MNSRVMNEKLEQLAWLNPGLTFDELRELLLHPPAKPIEKAVEKPVVKSTTRKVTKTRKVVLPVEK